MNKNNLRKKLSEMAYNVTQNSHTEPAYSGMYNDFLKLASTTVFVVGKSFFNSKDKFKSSSGWPSFTNAIKSVALCYIKDESYNMIRTG